MAEQRRRTTGSRPVARRRAPVRRRDHTRWLVPLLAVTVGAVVLAPQLTPVLVDLTATDSPVVQAPTAVPAPAPAPAEAPVLAQAQGVDTLADVAAARAGTRSRAEVAAGAGGLVVPQPPRPGRITIVPNASVGRAPVYETRPDGCGGAGTTPRRVVPGVVPGPGSATLDWMSDDRPEVVGYRVQAVSQRMVGGQQPPPVVRAVDQVEGCEPMTVTVDGLTPGEPYVFWFEEQVTSASTGVTRLVQVGTTAPVVIG